MSEIDLFLARIPREEGERLLPYDDATGAPVTAPKGKLSWGRGYNIMACGSRELFDAMDRVLVAQCARELAAYSWYQKCDPVRRSVLLDVAYNEGVGGLLHFPSMIHYLDQGDIVNAVAQLHVKDAQLDLSRYAPLRELLAKGGDS